jgi:hypothetical protein
LLKCAKLIILVSNTPVFWDVSIIHMKKILSSFLKKDTTANLSHRLSWLAELSHTDDTDRLRASIKHITSILNDTSLTSPEKTGLLFTILETNKDAVDHQITIFAKSDNLKPDITDLIIDTNYAYNRIIFLALIKLTEISFTRTPHQQPSQQIKLYLISRALISATHMLKWRYFQHATAPANLWKQTSELYKFAQSDALTKQEVQAYTNMSDTTIERLTLELYMLGGLNFNNLIKQQLEIISELLPIWSKDIRVKNKLENFHTFYIDLNKDQAARRIRKSTPSVLCLYWDLDEIEYVINDAILLINQHKKPSLLDYIKIKNPTFLREALTFLKKEWSRNEYKRQRRKESRTEITKQAYVNIGIKSACELMDQLGLSIQVMTTPIDGMINEKKQTTSLVMKGLTNTLVIGKENWSITDESQQGLGTLIQENKKLQIKPRKLVSFLTTKSHAYPAVGVVRNIKQIAGGNFKIGLEVFTDQPNLAYLKKFTIKKEYEATQNTLQESATEHAEFTCIYIPQNILSGQIRSLILPKIEYIPNSFYEVRFKNKREIIKLENPIECGDDWIKVNFPEAQL